MRRAGRWLVVAPGVGATWAVSCSGYLELVSPGDSLPYASASRRPSERSPMAATYQSENGVLFRRNLGSLACVALPGLLALGVTPFFLTGSGAEPTWLPL